MDANHKSGKDYTVIDVVDDRKTSKRCIFRVPNVLRRQNPEAYTPDVVSIGPFHYQEKQRKEEGKEGVGEKDFQLMERVKESYLKEILTGMKNITLEELTAKVTELSYQKNEGSFEERARNFYAEPLDHISSKDFLEMMIVDGCFLVQLFRKCGHSNLRDSDDPVFNMDCMFHFLCHDILLLENQLPWFVIYNLYCLTLEIYPPGKATKDSLSCLILKALTIVPSLKQSCSNYSSHRGENQCDAGVLHILDLVRASIIISDKRAQKADRKEANNQTKEHQEHSGSTGDNASVHDDVLGPDQHQICTATALSKADIKFKGVTDNKMSIMDIEFKEGKCRSNGTLIIPQLNVGMSSETLFRNLIAAEQCYHGYTNEITSYAILMDNLISSKEDLDLLCKEKVIGNWLSEEDGCKFFSNLYKDIHHNKDFRYVVLCEIVNKRYKLRRYTWLALLKSEKFANPWRILAFVVGVIILVLTAWSSVNNIRRKK